MIFLLHPPKRVFYALIAPRKPARQLALLTDPLVNPDVDGLRHALGQSLRRGTEAFDGDESRDALRVDTGVAERDIASERMRDDAHRCQTLLMDELVEIVDVFGHRVAAVGGPLTVAVAAKIGRDDVPVVAQRLCGPVPVATVIAPTVKEQQRWLRRVAPVDVMQAQTLREERVRVHRAARYHGAHAGGSHARRSRTLDARFPHGRDRYASVDQRLAASARRHHRR